MRYAVRQNFPLWGKSGLQADAARASAAEADAEVRQTRAGLREAIRQSWLDYWRAEQSLILTRDMTGLLQQMDLVTRQRYELGQSGQSDVLRVQSELSMLRSEQLQWQGQSRQARARLAALLGVESGTLVLQLDPLPLPARMDDAPLWKERALAASPEIDRARQILDMATAQEELTRLNGRPGLTVGVAAIQMESRLNLLELMLEVEIPLQQGARQAERSSASARVRQARARLDAARLQLQQDIDSMLAMHSTAQAQATLIDGTLGPQAELAFAAALTRYQSGRGEFASLLEAQQQIRRLRQMRLMADVEQFQAWIGLQRLTGDTP